MCIPSWLDCGGAWKIFGSKSGAWQEFGWETLT